MHLPSDPRRMRGRGRATATAGALRHLFISKLSLKLEVIVPPWRGNDAVGCLAVRQNHLAVVGEKVRGSERNTIVTSQHDKKFVPRYFRVLWMA